MPSILVKPVLDTGVRSLCIQAYPNHPKGCPNYGQKLTCPPNAPIFDRIINIHCPVYAIYNVFDLEAHRERMRKLHPEWSPRQLDCCLYWQPSARKQLNMEIYSFLLCHTGWRITTCPEAEGVNVTDTMKRAGVFLEWPPVHTTYQIALAGVPFH